MKDELHRFLDTQEDTYDMALAEIKSGKKRSHWMWYIFPQIRGLGFSETAKYYAIHNRAEAELFLNHPVLGKRLREISAVLLTLKENNPTSVFGSPDDLKLKSSMTLFSLVEESDENVFSKVLKKYYGGSDDEKTRQLLNSKRS